MKLAMIVQLLVSSWAAIPTVETTYGAIQGNNLAGLKVDEFLSVPYAHSERFSSPEDWSAQYSHPPLQATSYGPSCPQSSGQIYNASYTDEDCLSINFWKPSAKNTEPLPMLIFIHGGGLAFGGSSVFNGSVLASKQQVVVGSLNYRLGYLGFMAFEEDAAAKKSTGNQGMEVDLDSRFYSALLVLISVSLSAFNQDQQSALRFVQRVAAAFGGDKSRVMIFGQSAGGASVHKHLVMPSSAGLFQSAVLESGTTHSWDLPHSLSRTKWIAEAVGCTVAPLKECMRKVPMQKYIDLQGAQPAGSSFAIDELALVTVDGVLLPDNPEKMTVHIHTRLCARVCARNQLATPSTTCTLITHTLTRSPLPRLSPQSLASLPTLSPPSSLTHTCYVLMYSLPGLKFCRPFFLCRRKVVSMRPMS
jgi:carboxylesterase type B